MEIALQPDLEKFLRTKIESGRYHSLDEAINDSIRQLMNQDLIYRGRFEELKQEISLGIEASARGEIISSDEMFEQLRQKVKQYRSQDNHE